MTNWPYDKIFNQPDGEIIQQEFITYKRVNGRLHRETITRRFYKNDYQDSVSSTVLDATN